MKTAAKEKVKTGTRTGESGTELIQAEVSRGAIRALTIAAGLVALWVAACIVGGIIVSGGPVALVKGWIAAVTGM
ncbi:MAG TPA: hypothetical protein ENK27_12455 [Desulfobulbus sp.]|nr:hypothetical protein [Desulfobulbus sp.]